MQTIHLRPGSRSGLKGFLIALAGALFLLSGIFAQAAGRTAVRGTNGVVASSSALASEVGPTLVLAYGDDDRVRLVARGGAGPLGVSFERLLALAGAVREQMPTAEEGETPVRTTPR